MKTVFQYIIVLLLSTTFLACDKLDDNGDLGGLWQMTEWKSLPDGTIKATKQDAIFYAVQLDLMKFSINYDDETYHLARFKHKGNTLEIGTVYTRPDETIVPASALAKYGVPASGKFIIDKLSSSEMVLRSDDAILKFRKY